MLWQELTVFKILLIRFAFIVPWTMPATPRRSIRTGSKYVKAERRGLQKQHICTGGLCCNDAFVGTAIGRPQDTKNVTAVSLPL